MRRSGIGLVHGLRERMQSERTWIIDRAWLQRALVQKLARMRWCLARWTHSPIDRTSLMRSLCVCHSSSVSLYVCPSLPVSLRLRLILLLTPCDCAHARWVTCSATNNVIVVAEWPVLVVTSRLTTARTRWVIVPDPRTGQSVERSPSRPPTRRLASRVNASY